MITRREFIIGTSTFALAPMLACSNKQNGLNYDDVVKQTYRHAQQPITKPSEILHELVRYGTMAANSHNTQPWKFKITGNEIHIFPDLSRRCPAVDPDDHHLFASLGCAAENLLVAANSFGLHGDLIFKEADETSLIISFEKTRIQNTSEFEAIPERQCTRAVFNGSRVPASTLNDVATYANSSDIDIHLLTTDDSRKVITEYVVEGNSAQMDDEAFVEELRDWIRFNETEALQTRDGLTYRSVGSPSAPHWLGEILFKMMFRKNPENDKYREQIASVVS
ncbi:MAG: Tat pathway signal protein [Nitrospirota bacterium]|nr:Tat pathway signal protein [Nitrospirota bacterium]